MQYGIITDGFNLKKINGATRLEHVGTHIIGMRMREEGYTDAKAYLKQWAEYLTEIDSEEREWTVEESISTIVDNMVWCNIHILSARKNGRTWTELKSEDKEKISDHITKILTKCWEPLEK